MSVFIITIRDTENGVEINSTDVSDAGERNTLAVVLGAAMVDNATRYIEKHAERIAPVQAQTMH